MGQQSCLWIPLDTLLSSIEAFQHRVPLSSLGQTQKGNQIQGNPTTPSPHGMAAWCLIQNAMQVMLSSKITPSTGE